MVGSSDDVNVGASSLSMNGFATGWMLWWHIKLSYHKVKINLKDMVTNISSIIYRSLHKEKENDWLCQQEKKKSFVWSLLIDAYVNKNGDLYCHQHLWTNNVA